MKTQITIRHKWQSFREKKSKEILKYGNIITDDFMEDKIGNFVRIRVIRYDDKIYYLKMKNGLIEDLVEFNDVEL